MKTSREHYELMHKQIEEDLKKNYEEKLQKVIENAIGTLAPHGIYGGGNPWTLSKPDIKREDIPIVSDSTAANCSWVPTNPTIGSTATKSSTTDGNTQKVKIGPKLNPTMSYQIMGPPPPKMASFHGKSEWNPHLVQFNMIASRYNRNNEQRRERLVESLRDKALK